MKWFVRHFLREIQGRLASLIDEIFRKPTMLLFPRQLVQLHQRHLDDLMPRITMPFSFFRSEGTVNQIHIPQHGIEEPALPRRPIIRDRRLQHMSRAVELMIVSQIGPALRKTMDDIIGIQVSVRLLRTDDLIHGLIHRSLQG